MTKSLAKILDEIEKRAESGMGFLAAVHSQADVPKLVEALRLAIDAVDQKCADWVLEEITAILKKKQP